MKEKELRREPAELLRCRLLPDGANGLRERDRLCRRGEASTMYGRPLSSSMSTSSSYDDR